MTKLLLLLAFSCLLYGDFLAIFLFLTPLDYLQAFYSFRHFFSSNFGLQFWTPTFELCFTWWIKVGTSPSPVLGQTLGTNLDRSIHLLFRKAVYYVILSKYWLVWVVVWSSSLCEAVELSLSGGAVVPAHLSSLGLCGSTSGWVHLSLRCNRLFSEFSRRMDWWIVRITSVGNGVDMLISQVWRCCSSRNPFWKRPPLAGRGCC